MLTNCYHDYLLLYLCYFLAAAEVIHNCVTMCCCMWFKKAPPLTPTFFGWVGGGGCKFMTNCNIHRCLFEFQTSLLVCLHLLWTRCSLKLFSYQLSPNSPPFNVRVGESCQKWNAWITTITFTAITLLTSTVSCSLFSVHPACLGVV